MKDEENPNAENCVANILKITHIEAIVQLGRNLLIIKSDCDNDTKQALETNFLISLSCLN